jgi:hypothetical protein
MMSPECISGAGEVIPEVTRKKHTRRNNLTKQNTFRKGQKEQMAILEEIVQKDMDGHL